MRLVRRRSIQQFREQVRRQLRAGPTQQATPPALVDREAEYATVDVHTAGENQVCRHSNPNPNR